MEKQKKIESLKKDPRISPDLAKEVFTAVTESFFFNGDLTESDLNLPAREFLEKVISIAKKNDLKMVVDHRKTILSQANFFLNGKRYDHAKVFYATFFEHALNGMIHFVCIRRKINEKSQTAIIRGVDLQGKLSWLPILLGHAKFNEKHVATIKKLADDRNAFIHYKWKIDSEDDPHDTEIEAQFKKIKLAVKYIRQYESKLFYGDNRSKLLKKIRKP